MHLLKRCRLIPKTKFQESQKYLINKNRSVPKISSLTSSLQNILDSHALQLIYHSIILNNK